MVSRAGVFVLAIAGVILAALVGSPPASATSCAPVPHFELRRHADVIFDGVALSGRRNEEGLVSPARFQVVRYLKGRGPDVVRVRTIEIQVTPGNWTGVFGVIVGEHDFLAGQTWRIYGTTPHRADHSARGGVVDDGLCGATTKLPFGTGLRAVADSQVVARGIGNALWHARLLRGPGSVRCVRIRLGHHRRGNECRRLDRAREVLLAVRAHGQSGEERTALAVAARRLDEIDVTWPGGTKTKDANGAGRLALVSLPGLVDPDSLKIVAHFRDGGERTVDRTARRVLAADPDGGLPWEAVAEHGYWRAPGLVCTRWGPTPSGLGFPVDLVYGECGNLRKHRLFFAFRRFLEFQGNEEVTTARALFGAVGPGVTEVSVEGPDGTRSLGLSKRGRAFITVYGPDVHAADLTVTFKLADGSSRVFEGQRSANLHTPRKPTLG